MNFISGIVEGSADERVHSILTRYGRGTFGGPAAEAEVSGRRLKVSASYLFVPILGGVLAGSCREDLTVSGVIVSKVDTAEAIEDHGLEILDVKKRGGFKYKVGGTLSPDELAALYDGLPEAAVLVKAKAKGRSLGVGSSIPKPKKFSESGFCKLVLPAGNDNMLAILRSLAPGYQGTSFESISVSYTIRVDDLVVPEGASDRPASDVRLAAKRKGIMTRELVVDGERSEDNFEFCA
jgi:hypothetical protein